MKSLLNSIYLSTFLVLLVAQMPVAAQQADKVVVTVKTERDHAIYKKDEEVTFLIEVKDDKGKALDWGKVNVVISEDRYRTIQSFPLDVRGKVLKVVSQLSRPGFLQCEVQFDAGDRKIKNKLKPSLAAAAIDPLQITPSREIPTDFSAFWDSQRQLLAEIPIEAKMSKVAKHSDKALELFDVQLASLGDAPVSGYFSRPVGAKAKSLPIILWVHGAGVRSSSVKKYPGFLSMDINAHGIPNGKPKAYYDQLYGKDGRLKGYPLFGRENRDAVYFKNMFLRMIRAIDFLTAQPEWDGKTVAVIGHSQGGYQALVAGGLDDRVTFIGAGVPAGCDHTGMLRKRISGWPKLVPMQKDGKPDAVIAENARYYDAVNFASRYHGEAILSVGFIDRTCPPTSVYAAYNVLKGKKSIINKPAMGHAAPAPVSKAFYEALKSHIAQLKTEK
ncbi:MAG: acetylxylan esterase [Verrucomicrobiales bacterium]|nr:acetylxylan esterase [Verrucomicrobiales bacterium]